MQTLRAYRYFKEGDQQSDAQRQSTRPQKSRQYRAPTPVLYSSIAIIPISKGTGTGTATTGTVVTVIAPAGYAPTRPTTDTGTLQRYWHTVRKNAAAFSCVLPVLHAPSNDQGRRPTIHILQPGSVESGRAKLPAPFLVRGIAPQVFLTLGLEGKREGKSGQELGGPLIQGEGRATAPPR